MIDSGPLRISRPTGRQDAYRNRNESVRYQTEEPLQPEPVSPPEPPRPTQRYRQAEPGLEPEVMAPRKAGNFGWVKWVAVALIVGLIAVAGWTMWPKNSSIAATIDTSKYQAVFLSNGQVYFGKLALVNGDFMKLTNVYYLERQLTATTGTGADGDANKQPAAAEGDNNFQLLKYSDVLYGSEDAMIISKDDIIRYENLRSDGVVAKAIANRR